MDKLSKEELLNKEEKGGSKDFLSEFRMRETTEAEITGAKERILGYRTADKAGEYLESFPPAKLYEVEKREIDEEIEDILDASDELLENKNDPVVLDNLLDSLNSLLDDLWDLRQEREREFSKLIVLVKTITKLKKIDFKNEIQLKALFELIRIFKRPKIVEIDIKDGVKIIKEAKLDLYGPLKSKPKLRITIEEET